MMNYDHLHPEFRFVMALSDAERVLLPGSWESS